MKEWERELAALQWGEALLVDAWVDGRGFTLLNCYANAHVRDPLGPATSVPVDLANLTFRAGNRFWQAKVATPPPPRIVYEPPKVTKPKRRPEEASPKFVGPPKPWSTPGNYDYPGARRVGSAEVPKLGAWEIGTYRCPPTTAYHRDLEGVPESGIPERHAVLTIEQWREVDRWNDPVYWDDTVLERARRVRPWAQMEQTREEGRWSNWVRELPTEGVVWARWHARRRDAAADRV